MDLRSRPGLAVVEELIGRGPLLKSGREDSRDLSPPWADRIGKGANRHLAGPIPMRFFLTISAYLV